MQTIDAFAEGYRDRSGVDELRAEAFPFVAALVTIGTWTANVALIPNGPEISLALPVVIGILGTVGYRLLGQSVRVASALFVGGLMAVALAAIWIYPDSLAACLLAPVVLIAGLLLGPGSGMMIALVGSGMLLIARSPDVAVISSPTGTMAMALIWATALLSWLASRSVYTALDWAWHSYAQSLQKVQELQRRQGELNRALKGLNEAYYRLEQVNTELERARAAAKEAHQLKAQFAATISHELRTPLNLIIGFSEMMATSPHSYSGGSLPPDYQSDVDAIYRNARHLSNLIDDILDLSQIEAGRMALQRQPSELSDIIAGAVGPVRTMFERKGIDLVVEALPDLPPLLVDPTRVSQILLNLLSNAARFTENGFVNIKAWSEAGQVIISVSDTGPGIAPEDLSTVFDEFRQVDGSIRRRYGGSGLGLAICKSFVELHGGNIWVESRPGRGSTFSFSLPLQGSIVTAPPRAEWETWVRPGVGQREDQRVLVVVDSELEGGRLFRRYIDGWRVVISRDAAGARRLARQTPVGGVIHFVPHDANPLSHQVAWVPDQVPVIACTLHRHPEPRLELNIYGRLTKPVQSDQVASQLHRLPSVQDVLIVDDDPEMVRLLARMVRSFRRRARIRGAYGGTEAMAAMEAHRPDVIFLDLLMSEIDGYTVLERMRADDRFKDVPVVIVSAHDSHTETATVASISIIRKDGFSVAELMRCVESCLNALSGQHRSTV